LTRWLEPETGEQAAASGTDASSRCAASFGAIVSSSPPGSGHVLLGRRPCLRGEGGLGVFGGQLQSRGRERGRELLLLVGMLSSLVLERHWIFLVDRDAQCCFFGAGSSLGRAGFALLHPRFGGREHVEGATRGGKGPRGGSVGCKRGGLKKGKAQDRLEREEEENNESCVLAGQLL
jgi:hypothetical protein